MGIYDEQVALLKARIIILKNSICDVGGHLIVSPSAMKSVLKVLYDVDHSVDSDGAFVLYLTLKKEFEKYDFEDSFYASIPADRVDKLDIDDPSDREAVQFSMAISGFSEVEFIEEIYLDIAKNVA